MLNADQMTRYRAARAKGNSVDSSRCIARGDHDRTRIALDWDGDEKAEATVGDYEIVVEIKPDYDTCIDEHLEGEFSEDASYRLLPWGGKRRFSRRYVLASALTQTERLHRKHAHEPSTRSERNYSRDAWNVWYTDFGIAGGSPKHNTAKQKYDLMGWYWRHGYSKSDAYLKAVQEQRKAADYASSGNLEYYDLHVTITRIADGEEVADAYRGSYDVDGSEPWFKAFQYIKDEASVFVADTLHEMELEKLKKYGVAQESLF